MKVFTRAASLSVVAVVLLVASLAARADVPGRVGRIAFMEGDVQAYSESDPEWKVAYVNQPITSRNSVFVGDAGRAEISVGSTTLAMDAGSQVDIQELDDNTLNANVVRGRVSMRVRRFDADDAYNVAVPGADFALLRPGRYRIDALQSTGGITVFEGQASAQGDGGAVVVEAGNAVRVFDSPDQNAATQLLSAAPVAVPLDDWVLAREARFRNSQAERYVSPNMTGYEDLDANGRWATEADVGPVWYPTTYVQPDWAPYRYGRWSYVAPWGYTWIDDAPWGFAPFHYGRWLQVGGRWGWCPGAYVARPAFAPALVGFYGGDGFSASFAAGAGPAVGWYPLAPWQRYSPHYTQNARYLNQVNNIVIVNPPRRFGDGNGGHEWNRERGGTVVPRDAFASQRSISRIAIAAPRNAFERGRPVNIAELPRPSIVPGAVRRGPDRDGDGRPDFRSPREFASRPGNGGGRSFDGAGRPSMGGVQPPGQDGSRGSLPPNYRRLPEPRPNAGIEQQRPAQVPGVVQGDRSYQQRDPNTRGFDRDRQRQEIGGVDGQAPAIVNRPRYEPPIQAPLRGDGVTNFPQPQQQPGRPFERPNREMRAQPPQQAIQAPIRGDGETNPQAQQPGRSFERPNREMRMQPPPQAVQAPMRSDGETNIGQPRPQMQQQQPPRQFERQREMRNMQAPPQATQPVEAPRPQRFERPAQPQVAAPPPGAPAAAPAAPAPRQFPQRGQPFDRAGQDGGR